VGCKARRLSSVNRRRLRELLLPGVVGLAIGLFGALLAVAAHTPLPWLIGPLLAVAVARFSGANCGALAGGRQVGQWIIGTALGLYFTPHVATLVGRLWWLLLLSGAFALALGYVCGFLLDGLSHVGRTTAVFASVPGGAAEMSLLGERYGARPDVVAAAQSLRIIIVVLTIPAIFAALGLHGSDPFEPATADVHVGGLAALLCATLIGGLLLARAGVPNAYILGALAVGIGLTAAEIKLSAMPRTLSNAAQLLLGCALGARFERAFLREAPRLVAAIAVSVGTAMVLTALFASAAGVMTDLHVATLVLATAPGGIAEMAITAKVLELGVPVVTAFHVTRVAILLTCTGPVFVWLRGHVQARRSRGSPRGPVA
jgi:membrane AbrB-like protein